MKKTIIFAFCCMTGTAYAYPGGLAPGQTLATRPVMTPGATAVSNSGALGASGLSTTGIPPFSPSANSQFRDDADFRHRQDEQVHAVRQHIFILQHRLDCLQAATDPIALAACSRP